MSSTKALNGFHASRKRGSGANSTGNSRYQIAQGTNLAMYSGDLMKIGTGGFVTPITTTTDYAIGVLEGVRYVDKTSKQPKWSRYIASSVSSDDGLTYALINDDPEQTYIVQGDASLTVGDLLNNFNVTLGAGSTVTGQSGFGIKIGSVTTGTAMLRPVGLWDVPGNAWGDAFTKVECRIVRHVDKQQAVVACVVGPV
jgi:hypothetical protein